MKVLMLGWEFPPYFAGGVGMVCYELTKAFAKRDDIEVTYIMPYGPKELKGDHIKIIVADNIISNDRIKIKRVPSLLGAYMSHEDYVQQKDSYLSQKEGNVELKDNNTLSLYGSNLIEEVQRFKEKVKLLIENEDFDVIHAHDWTTFPAAIAARKISGKPFVAHVHITEYDKSGGAGANPYIYTMEREGMHKADKVIAISDFVRQGLIKNYGVNPDKIMIIHNGGVEMKTDEPVQDFGIKKHDKIVLFAGRVTLQKGPEYFIDAAKKVCELCENIKFVMAGSGDQLPKMIDKSVELGISDKFVFHGFYTRPEAEKLFTMADIFVMPSVSEPFGLVPFEAMCKGTPSIISKQSGCSEVLKNALKVDFWDIDEMANKIISVLNYKELHNTIKNEGLNEIKRITWDKPAEKCINLYNQLIFRHHKLF